MTALAGAGERSLEISNGAIHRLAKKSRIGRRGGGRRDSVALDGRNARCLMSNEDRSAKYRPSKAELLSVFIFGHITMDTIAGAYIEYGGTYGPTYLLIAMTLVLCGIWTARKRQPLINLVMLFVPVAAGFMLHQMFEDFVDESRWWIALLAPLLVAFLYYELSMFLFG